MVPPPIETQGGQLREVHLRDYWKIIWQGRWSILAVFFLTVAASAVWTFMQTPVYQATTTVEVQPKARQIAAGQDLSGLGAAGYGWFAEEKYHNTQVEIIKSRDVAERVVEQLGLGSHPDFVEVDDVPDVFRKMLKVNPRRDTGLIEISIVSSDPEQCARWVNAVATTYVKRNYEKAQENMADSVDAIRAQLDELRSELLEAESRRVTILGDTEIYNSENQEAILTQTLTTYNAELSTVQIRRNTLETTLNKVSDLQLSGGDMLSIPELADDPSIRELYRNKIELERDLESAKVELLPGHPYYDKKDKELARVVQRINEKMSEVLGTIQNRLDAAITQERSLKGKINLTKADSLDVAKRTSKYDVVRIDAETHKAIFDLVAQAMNEVQLGAQLMTNNVAVLDEARAPRYPIAPRKRLNLAIGVFLGVFLGIALVFFLDYLDNTFRTSEDIEKYLQLSVLGVVPKLQEEGLAHRAVKEAYTSLRTSIIFSSKNRKRKVILTTSVGPQEGKSSTVANLGRTLAQSGDRTIILDCDLRRPTQHLIHDVAREPGMTNYLAAPEGETDWRPFIKTSSTPNLDILSCGPIPPNPAELLSSSNFKDLLDSLRESYDWILVDSPPASSLADAPVLAELVDMIVLVIKHNATDRDNVAKGLQRLRAVDAVVAGAVLNNVDISRAFNKDYYYSGYYYLSDEDKAKSDKRSKPTKKSKVS
jgi:succinoglycan biosynthesis transport protein ExoP